MGGMFGGGGGGKKLAKIVDLFNYASKMMSYPLIVRKYIYKLL